VSDAADLIRAIAWLLWPLLVVVLVFFAWRGRTALGPLLRGRGFTIRLPGGFELTLQEAADQERRFISDLIETQADQEERLRALESEREPEPDEEEPDGKPEWVPAAQEPGPGPPPPRHELRQARRILWVGESIRADASIAAAQGVDVVTVNTVEEAALERITPDIDAVVCDSAIGFALLDALRGHDYQPPVALYEPRGVAGLGNWNKMLHQRGAYGLAMTFSDLESVLRSAGVSLFPVSGSTPAQLRLR
jgi:hypothetical protein